MRFLIHWILAFFIFLNPTIVLPALTDYDRQEFAFKNALADKNPGFESGSAGWTCSPSMVIDTDAADQIVPRSKGFATWDSTSAGQNCYSTAVKIPQSGNCAVGIWYKIPSGTGTHLIVANDGTNDLATESIVSSTLAQYQEVEFPCASSSTGNARIGIRSVASNEPLIAKDDAYIGRATQVRDVNINTERKAWTPTGVWVSNATYTGFESRVGDTQHVWFRISLGGAPSGTLTMNIPSGCTIDTAKTTGNNARNSLGDLLIFDSDTGAQIPGKVQGSSTTAVALNVILTGNASTAPISNITATAPITFASGDTIDGYFSVPCVGFSARTALDVAEQGWYVDAEISGGNPSLGTASVSSYTELTNASLTMTPRSGSAPVGIMCSSTNAAATPTTSTSTCSAGSESLGGTFVVTRSGSYDVCMDFAHNATVDQAVGVNAAFQVVETPTNAQTITTEGGSRIQSSHTGMAIASGNSDSKTFPHKVCGQFNWSAGTKGVRLMYEQLVGGTPVTSQILADASASVGQRNFRMTVRPVTGQQQTVLANSVSTPIANGEKIGSAQINCDSSSAILRNRQSMVSSVGNISSGVCSVTLASGYFSGVADCVASWNGDGGAPTLNPYIICSSATACNVGTFNDSNVAQTIGNYAIMCFGPR